MQFDESDDTATGILPSNKSFRPTQGALRHSDDTEFNDALRARGIIPPKPEARRSPSPELASTSKLDRLETADLDDDDELLGLEDDIPQAILDRYRAARVQEAEKVQRTRRFGSVIPIGREEYTREVTEASERDIEAPEGSGLDEDEFKGKGTGVVCFLWKDSVPESQLLKRHLDTLAAAYPSTKFVSIRGDMCIANYPDKNIPTMLIYRAGQLKKQIVGLRPELGLNGMRTTSLEVEALLTLCDAIDPFLRVSRQQKPSSDDDDEDEDDDDSRAGRKSARTRIRMGDAYGTGRARSGQGGVDDDELDL